MGKIKIRNKQTGEIKEIDESEMGNYGLGGQTAPITPANNTETQVQNITGRSLLDHQRALQAARAAGDTTAAKQIQADFDTEFNYQKTFNKTAQEDATDKQIKLAEMIIKELEDNYFRELEEGKISHLAYAKEGLGGRLGGTFKDIERQISPKKQGKQDDPFASASGTEQLNTYKRLLESSGARFAKAGGDAANVALMEQILQRRGFGMETDTPEEAFALFRTARAKFGLEPNERLQKLEESYKSGSFDVKKESQPETMPTSNEDNLLNLLSGSNVSKVLGGLGPQGISGLDIPVLGDILFPRAKEVREKIREDQPVNLDEVAGAGGEYARNVGYGLGGILPMAIGGFSSGATTPGATPEERLQAGVTEGAIGGVLGRISKFLGGAKNVFTGKNVSQAAGFRGDIATKTTHKFSTNNLVKAAEDYVKNDPAAKRLWETTIKPSFETGQLTADELVKRIGIWGNKAFTLSGKQGKPAAAGLYAELSRAGRKLLEEVPELAKAHQQFAKATGLHEGVSGTLKKLIFPSAVGAGVGIPMSFALSRVFGQGKD